jgi:hypothetical protein
MEEPASPRLLAKKLPGAEAEVAGMSSSFTVVLVMISSVSPTICFVHCTFTVSHFACTLMASLNADSAALLWDSSGSTPPIFTDTSLSSDKYSIPTGIALCG